MRTPHARAQILKSSHRTSTVHVHATSTHAIDRAYRTAHARPTAHQSRQHCWRTICPPRAAAAALSMRKRCHATSMLHCALPTSTPFGRRTDGREARRRHPRVPPRRPTVLRAHCRELWQQNAPAAPDCRAPAPAHCPPFALPTAPSTPARATAAKIKVLAATH